MDIHFTMLKTPVVSRIVVLSSATHINITYSLPCLVAFRVHFLWVVRPHIPTYCTPNYQNLWCVTTFHFLVEILSVTTRVATSQRKSGVLVPSEQASA
jgi:hypothetical protein